MLLQSQEQLLLQQHFCIATPNEAMSGQMWSVSDLVDEKRIYPLVQQLSNQLGTDLLPVTAAYLSKHYAYMLVVSVLYAMSVMNKGLDVSIENIRIHFRQESGNIVWKLILNNWNISRPHINRESWREDIVRELFGNIAQVWEALHKSTGASKRMMWENTASYVYWLYEDKLRDLPLDRKQVENDFHYLLNAPAEFFWETYQPLQRFYHSKINVAWTKQPVRMRKTCCLYYQLNSEGNCCYTCPRLMKQK